MQAESSHRAIVPTACLVILPPAAVSPADASIYDGELRILGLSLRQRADLGAHRAGYAGVFFLTRNRAGLSDPKAIFDWRSLADTLSLQPMSLVIAPATVVAETDWLRKLAAGPVEPAVWASIPNHIVVLSAKVLPDALAMLEANGGAFDIKTIEQRLASSFGLAATIPSNIDPLVLAKPADIPLAERRLLRGLVKDTDGFMARKFDRHISLQISRRLASTNVRPTQVTLVSTAIGLCGAPFLLSAHWAWQTFGALLFLLHSIVDGCDGELARLKFQESRIGGLLDFWGDNLVHAAVFGCIAVGWALSSGTSWPLWLGAVAIIGTLASAVFVYWKQMRGKDGGGPLFTSVSATPDDRLSRMLDAASRRDFIYALPILTLFGKSSWFLIAAALGAPIFFFLLIILWTRGASGSEH